MHADLELDATHERRGFWSALEPFVELSSRAAPGIPRPSLRVVVAIDGPRPAVLIAVAANHETGRPGRYLAGLPLARCPGGAEIHEAAQRVVAGALAGLGEEAAAIAIDLAARWSGSGGFVVVGEPESGELRALLAPPGGDLGLDALEIGRLCDETSLTAH